jgi:hypothetical protein
MLRYALSFALCLLTVGATPVPDDEWAARGAEALKPYKASLQAALRSGLAKGQQHAISVCSLEAPQLADKAGAPGVRVGRSTDRARNPKNKPADWLAPVVAAYASNPAAAKPQVVHRENGAVGYVEPIFVQKTCLMCHGDMISEPVRYALAERYPDDKATGYKEGDFRGVFWVEFAAE